MSYYGNFNREAKTLATSYYTKALHDYTGRAEVLSSPTAITIQSIVDNVRNHAANLPVPSGEAGYIAALEAKHSAEMLELRSIVLDSITEYKVEVRNLAETLLTEKHRQILQKN
jgi:hypothetical protein